MQIKKLQVRTFLTFEFSYFFIIFIIFRFYIFLYCEYYHHGKLLLRTLLLSLFTKINLANILFIKKPSVPIPLYLVITQSLLNTLKIFNVRVI